LFVFLYLGGFGILGGVNIILADVKRAWFKDKEAIIIGGRFNNKG
jgi:hypothetical protein